VFVATWRTHNAIYSTLNHRDRAVGGIAFNLRRHIFRRCVGRSYVLGATEGNAPKHWEYVGILAGAFIAFAIAAFLAGAYFCLVEIAYNTRQQSEPR